MKTMKTLLASGLVAAAVAAPAMAELEASAAVSSQYLFRGVDQGGGGAVSGDLTYSNSGFYAGTWISSLGLGGDTNSEIDFFAGWGGEFGGLGVDIGAINYYYPGDDGLDGLGGEFSEAYLGLSFAGAEFYYYDNIAGDNGYVYYSLSYGMGPVSVLLGIADPEEAAGQTFENDYMHLDVTYAYNDNLSFTLSQIVDKDDELMMEDDLQAVVTYSLPIK